MVQDGALHLIGVQIFRKSGNSTAGIFEIACNVSRRPQGRVRLPKRRVPSVAFQDFIACTVITTMIHAGIGGESRFNASGRSRGPRRARRLPGMRRGYHQAITGANLRRLRLTLRLRAVLSGTPLSCPRKAEKEAIPQRRMRLLWQQRAALCHLPDIGRWMGDLRAAALSFFSVVLDRPADDGDTRQMLGLRQATQLKPR
jgi:hypothetical protein